MERKLKSFKSQPQSGDGRDYPLTHTTGAPKCRMLMHMGWFLSFYSKDVNSLTLLWKATIMLLFWKWAIERVSADHQSSLCARLSWRSRQNRTLPLKTLWVRLGKRSSPLLRSGSRQAALPGRSSTSGLARLCLHEGSRLGQATCCSAWTEWPSLPATSSKMETSPYSDRPWVTETEKPVAG